MLNSRYLTAFSFFFLILTICQCSNRTDPSAGPESPATANSIDYVIPVAEGNYWIYEGRCGGNAAGDSVSVSSIPTDSCELAFKIQSSRNNPEFSAAITSCDGNIYVNGRLWQAPAQDEYMTYTVPAGTFDSCYMIIKPYQMNGIDATVFAKGIGVIERGQVYFSVRSGDSYSCIFSLTRYRVAGQ